MVESFGQSLDEWTAFYALIGGVAATLLGLLFVAVSLRLNIFDQAEVADVRAFAHSTFISFLIAIAVAALALSPHEGREPLAVALLVMGLIGLFSMAWVYRTWRALNGPPQLHATPADPNPLQGWILMIVLSTGHPLLLVAALLIWRGNAMALGLLAIVEIWLLVKGTIAAWLLLSHAGHGGSGGA